MHSVRRQNCQLRHHLRHHDLRSCPTYETSKPRGKADHRRLLPHLPWCSGYMEKAKEMAREKGYAETLHRRRYLPDINSKNGTVRGFVEQMPSMPLSRAQRQTSKSGYDPHLQPFQSRRHRSKMIIQVHDELQFLRISEEKEKVEDCGEEEMQNEAQVCLWLLMPDGKQLAEAH